jgi:hypothetical protein
MRRPIALENVAPDARLLAVFSLAAAVLTVALIVLGAGPGPLEPAELLPYFHAHKARYGVSASVVLCWTVTALAFVAVLKASIEEAGRALAFAATLLAAAGIAMLGFGSFIGIGAFFALDDASAGIAARLQSPYQAAIWRGLSFLLSDPGLMTLGAGQVLFAWLALRTSLSRILVIIGFLGGIAGLLTLAVYQTPLLAFVQLAAFAVWAAAMGILLLRFKARPAVAAIDGT